MKSMRPAVAQFAWFASRAAPLLSGGRHALGSRSTAAPGARPPKAELSDQVHPTARVAGQDYVAPDGSFSRRKGLSSTSGTVLLYVRQQPDQGVNR